MFSLNFLKLYFVAHFTVCDPLEQFEASWILLSVTNYTVILILNLIILVGFLWYTRLGLFVTNILFVFFKSIYMEVFGYKNQEYFLFFFYVFLFILVNNFIGLLPYTYTATSYFVLTLFLSSTMFFGIFAIAVERKGLQFFSVFSLSNVPKLLYYFLVGIELISYFMRVISLATRLFANMVAGHALMKILLTFMWLGLMATGFPINLVVLVFWGFVVLVGCLELFISFLQAYVFVFLCLTYLQEAVQRIGH